MGSSQEHIGEGGSPEAQCRGPWGRVMVLANFVNQGRGLAALGLKWPLGSAEAQCIGWCSRAVVLISFAPGLKWPSGSMEAEQGMEGWQWHGVGALSFVCGSSSEGAVLPLQTEAGHPECWTGRSTACRSRVAVLAS